MSYTELIIFKDGKASDGVEYPNAWGGCARIWNAMFDAHVPKESQYDSWLHGDAERLWALASRAAIPMFERAVLAFTFDLFYVRREHFAQLAADLRRFGEKYPVKGNHVDHLPAWVDWLDVSDAEAVGLYGTSVARNLWYRRKACPNCGGHTGETEPVPLSEGTEVYDWLAKSAS